MANLINIRQIADTLTPAAAVLRESQLPFAMVGALNSTAYLVRGDLQADMRRVFKNPVRWTIGGVKYSKASKGNLTSSVFISEDGGKGIAPAKYLRPEIEGGKRRAKRFERALQAKGYLPDGWVAVPSKYLALDEYGNVKGGLVSRILSDLGAFAEVGYTANRVTKRVARASKGARKFKRSSGYFVVAPGGRAQPGVYATTAAGIKPVFIFVKGAYYSQTFQLERLSEEHALKRFPVEFNRAMAKALATAR